ncbi:MAG: hypothetical protein ACAH59_06880 [Pseudobdellovibrionaceae bacterium]
MKFLGLLTFLLGFSAFANNPQIRTCRITGGEFHAVRALNDEFGFCTYESAMMDSISLLLVTTSSQKTLAVQAFESGLQCSQSQGSVVRGEDLENKKFDLCVFSDESLVELGTLQAGPNASANTGLMKALQMRF